MDLKAARVVTAQGWAPQRVALLRTGAAMMTERIGDVVSCHSYHSKISFSEVIKTLQTRIIQKQRKKNQSVRYLLNKTAVNPRLQSKKSL
jgi:hypothetical protein